MKLAEKIQTTDWKTLASTLAKRLDASWNKLYHRELNGNQVDEILFIEVCDRSQQLEGRNAGFLKYF